MKNPLLQFEVNEVIGGTVSEFGILNTLPIQRNASVLLQLEWLPKLPVSLAFSAILKGKSIGRSIAKSITSYVKHVMLYFHDGNDLATSLPIINGFNT